MTTAAELRGLFRASYPELASKPSTQRLLEKLTDVTGTGISYESSFVFRPGEPNPGGNVFATWPAVQAALVVNEGIRFLLVDDSIESPAHATAGTWDMTNVRLTGSLDHLKFGNQPVQLVLDDNCVLLHWAGAADNMVVTSNAVSQPNFEMTAGVNLIFERGSSFQNASGGMPGIHVAGDLGTTPQIVLLTGGRLGDSGQVCVKIDAAIPAPLWSAVTAYTVGQTVSYLGSDYVCTAANTNQAPDVSPTFWLKTQLGTMQCIVGEFGSVHNDVIMNDGLLVMVVDDSISIQQIVGQPPGAPFDPPTQLGAGIFQLLNAVAKSFSFGAASLGAAAFAIPSIIPQGFGAQAVVTPGFVGEYTFSNNTLSAMVITHLGDPGNGAGQQILYELIDEFTSRVLFSTTLDANVFSLSFVQGLKGYQGGSLLALRATPTAPLTNDVTNISAWVG